MDNRKRNINAIQEVNHDSKEEIVELLMTNWCEDKRFENIRTLLKSRGVTDSELRKEIDEGNTLLHVMAKYNMPLAVNLLISKGADINAANNEGNTALHVAAKAGHCEMILRFFHLGINTSSQNKNGDTALHVAVREFQLESIETLLTLDIPIDRNIKNNNKYTAKMLIGTFENQSQMVKLANAFLLKKNIYASSRLHLAVINNNVEEVKMLLKYGASSNFQDKFGNTPAHYAAQNGFLEIFSLLCCQDKIDINIANDRGDTVLHFAVRSGSTEIVKLLCLDENTDINIVNKHGENALHSLVKSNHPEPECVKYLMKTNINILKKDGAGYTVKELVNQIRDFNLRKKLNFAFADVESTESLTTSSLTKPKIKNISINIQEGFYHLRNKLPNLNLREPKKQDTLSQLNKINACSLQTMKDIEATIIKSHESIPLLTRDDFDTNNLKQIKSYLVSGGDPNLIITDDQQTLIMYALRNNLQVAALELLRYGAKLSDSDLHALDLDNNPFIKDILTWIANELSSLYVKNLQVLNDSNIVREQNIFMRRLEELLLNPGAIQLPEPRKRDSKLIFKREIKKLSQTKDGIERIKLITQICNSNVISNHHSAKKLTLIHDELHKIQIDIEGLMSLYTPNEIVKSLLKIHPTFTKSQHLVGIFFVKELIIHSRAFGYNLSDANFITTYLQQTISDAITDSLKNIYSYLSSFEKNPTYLSHINLDKNLFKYSKKLKFNCIDIIDNASAHPGAIDLAAKSLAHDLVTLTIKFYHSTPLKKLHHIDKEGKYANNQFKFFGPLLTAFIQHSILRQDAPKKRFYAMCLFTKVALYCLNDPRVPDLNTPGSIVTAFNGNSLARLEIKLNKPNALIQEDLTKLFSSERNFSLYAEFQSVYTTVLPWMYLVSNRLQNLKQCKMILEQLQAQGEFYNQFIALRNNPDFYELHYTSNLYDEILKVATLRENELEELSLMAQPPMSPNLSGKCTYKEFTEALNRQMINKYPLTIKYEGKEYRNEEALEHIFMFLTERNASEKLNLKSDDIIKIHNSYKSYDNEYDSTSSLLQNSSESDVRNKHSSASDGSKPNAARFFKTLTRNPTVRGSTMSGSLPPSPKEQIILKEQAPVEESVPKPVIRRA